MRGEEKDFITVWLTLGQRTLRYETYVMPAPEENAATVYENLLRRNERLVGAHFSIGVEDAVFLRGELPVSRSSPPSSTGCSARCTPRSSSASRGCCASASPAGSPTDVSALASTSPTLGIARVGVRGVGIRSSAHPGYLRHMTSPGDAAATSVPGSAPVEVC